MAATEKYKKRYVLGVRGNEEVTLRTAALMNSINSCHPAQLVLIGKERVICVGVIVFFFKHVL